jgi:hypothetical protein
LKLWGTFARFCPLCGFPQVQFFTGKLHKPKEQTDLGLSYNDLRESRLVEMENKCAGKIVAVSS